MLGRQRTAGFHVAPGAAGRTLHGPTSARSPFELSRTKRLGGGPCGGTLGRAQVLVNFRVDLTQDARTQVHFRSDDRHLTDADRARRLAQRLEAQDDLRRQLDDKRARVVRAADAEPARLWSTA
jgi:hypothetical protein